MWKTDLKLKVIDDKYCILEEDYKIKVGNYLLTVPAGFKTDGASFPLILHPFFPRFGKYKEAAIVHDYLYSKYNSTGINRTLADKIFLKIMEEYGVNKELRKKMYQAVRAFGSVFWKAKEENEGYIDKAFIDRTDEALAYYNVWYEVLKLGGKNND